MKTSFREPELIVRNGRPVSVVLPLKDYEELLERLEDTEDAAWLRRLRRKPVKYRPLEEYLAACTPKAQV
jgi:PHD/YefM family antitoxin component YafN of YafNO toxin-antitoxin module